MSVRLLSLTIKSFVIPISHRHKKVYFVSIAPFAKAQGNVETRKADLDAKDANTQ